MDGSRDLPVHRFKLADAVTNSYDVSPRTGAVVDRYQTTSRSNWWLYHGLHSLDFPFLLYSGPA